jgi:hypothetical protein
MSTNSLLLNPPPDVGADPDPYEVVMEKNNLDYLDQNLAILGIVVICMASMAWLGVDAKDIIVGGVGGLVGFIGGQKISG